MGNVNKHRIDLERMIAALAALDCAKDYNVVLVISSEDGSVSSFSSCNVNTAAKMAEAAVRTFKKHKCSS